MNIRFIVLLLYVLLITYAFIESPMLAMLSIPSLLMSYWVWQDGDEKEDLRERLRSLRQELREK